jgi:DNA repair protein SbcD/Mre11
MRILHTSDWHLGHTLRDWDRAPEHAAFLRWLLSTLEAEKVDALLIAGDIFDAANPPASAQEAWYTFLASARAASPDLEIVVIGGNHDSPARLDAANPLLRAVRVHMIGGLPRDDEPGMDGRFIVPIRSRRGERALVAAVPFLRPGDLPVTDAVSIDPLVEGVRAVYHDAALRLRAQRDGGEPLLAMGHLYMAGSQLSEQSERPILGGNQHALPVDLFPDDVAYVALGHLHRAQHVGSPRIAYSGSPIPLSMAEAGYVHQVSVVDFEGAHLDRIRSLHIPRHVELLRIPAQGEAPLADVIRAIAALPDGEGMDESLHPFLEVAIALDRPEPTLQQQVQEALRGRAVRLVKLTRVVTGTNLPLAEATTARALDDLSPDQVFVERHRREFSAPPSEALLAAFHELLTDSREDRS